MHSPHHQHQQLQAHLRSHVGSEGWKYQAAPCHISGAFTMNRAKKGSTKETPENTSHRKHPGSIWGKQRVAQRNRGLGRTAARAQKAGLAQPLSTQSQELPAICSHCHSPPAKELLFLSHTPQHYAQREMRTYSRNVLPKLCPGWKRHKFPKTNCQGQAFAGIAGPSLSFLISCPSTHPSLSVPLPAQYSTTGTWEKLEAWTQK